MLVPTLEDWFSSSAFACYSDILLVRLEVTES